MSFTYSNKPGAVPVDTVRLLIGDTKEHGHLIEDEAVVYELTQASLVMAAANCCEDIAADLSKLVSKSVGDLSIQLSQKQDQFAQRARDLRARSGRGAGMAVMGDTSGLPYFTRTTFEERPSSDPKNNVRS